MLYVNSISMKINIKSIYKNQLLFYKTNFKLPKKIKNTTNNSIKKKNNLRNILNQGSE